MGSSLLVATDIRNMTDIMKEVDHMHAVTVTTFMI
jgi:hypothetical protein